MEIRIFDYKRYGHRLASKQERPKICPRCKTKLCHKEKRRRE